MSLMEMRREQKNNQSSERNGAATRASASTDTRNMFVLLKMFAPVLQNARFSGAEHASLRFDWATWDTCRRRKLRTCLDSRAKTWMFDEKNGCANK